MLKRVLYFIAASFVLVFLSVNSFLCFASEYETIVSGETKTVQVTLSGNTYLQFTPTVSGEYKFYSVSDMDTVGFLYESLSDMYIVSDDESGDGSNFCITYNLEAGTTYYYAVRFYNIAEGSFDVKLEFASCVHTNVITEVAVEATCNSVGYTQGSYCSDCGQVLISKTEIPLNYSNHTGVANTVKNAVTATCLTDGYSGDVYWSCCDTLYQKGVAVPFDSNQHSGKADVVRNVTTPTCTSSGYSGDIYWSCCNSLAVKGQTITENKENHTGKADVSRNTLTATCLSEGYSGDICWSCCGAVAISGTATPADSNAHIGKADVCKNSKPSSCTEKGYSGDIYWSCCDTLASKGVSLPVDKNSHSGKADRVKNDRTATCTDDGYSGDIYWSCCGEFALSGVKIEADKSAHTGKADVIRNKKAPECSSQGYTGDKYWSCCGSLYSKGSSISKTEHSYTSYKTVKPATCVSEGTKEKVCTVCGDTVSKVLDITEHSYKEVISQATLTKNGSVSNECSLCSVKKSFKVINSIKTIKLSSSEFNYNGKTQTPQVTVKDSKGKELIKDKDYSVKYGSSCKLPGTYTVTVEFKGSYKGTKKLTFRINPNTPEKLSAATSVSAIKLNWKKVVGAEGYRIYQYNSKTKKWVKIKTVKSGSGSSYKIKGLKSGTKYKFKIKAYTKDDGTLWSKSSSTFETATKTKTPSLKVTSEKGKAVLAWSDVKGESGYQVYFSTKKDSGFKKMATLKKGVSKISKSKLRSGKKYYFKVRAYTKTESGTVYSSWSKVRGITVK